MPGLARHPEVQQRIKKTPELFGPAVSDADDRTWVCEKRADGEEFQWTSLRALCCCLCCSGREADVAGQAVATNHDAAREGGKLEPASDMFLHGERDALQGPLTRGPPAGDDGPLGRVFSSGGAAPLMTGRAGCFATRPGVVFLLYPGAQPRAAASGRGTVLCEVGPMGKVARPKADCLLATSLRCSASENPVE
ncbi:hypothetical protein IscW_ISCW009426 [Ixodes scapularis]|uniref:Uncharacterized protein n=1 Tax=Ixodes scapularis TaxID=6945 RepID=B7PZC6_IXOSC|nr:hypothetical protein IscW_ISCW009426 [Ixodes scapularis]|eukprot:XP_002405098.1 hypothetical protein IscW_ISCW009426 [Ixodes scapularis]